jgi:hypothetical protein
MSWGLERNASEQVMRRSQAFTTELEVLLGIPTHDGSEQRESRE